MNTPNIYVGILDDFCPEVQAMSMAMYSRNLCSITNRIPVLTKDHKDKLLKYYQNYGHKSIGQCGTTTVFFEGISIIAAKAIENTPLFNGQECSTRYIDFSKQLRVNNCSVQDILIKEYIRVFPLIVTQLKLQHNGEGTIYDNAINARAYDICRGLLPGGVTTNVAFTGSFDTLNIHLNELRYHPEYEVRNIANLALNGLIAKYPNGTYLTDLDYAKDSSYHYQSATMEGISDSVPILDRSKWDKANKYFSSKFTFYLQGLLDYGSYRDLHRHRNGTVNFPKLNTSLGFNDWYLKQLPIETVELLRLLQPSMTTQYNTPIGYNVPVEYKCDYNQYMYMMELRTNPSSHPTLRKFMIDNYLGGALINKSTDTFNLHRGGQTF